ncbi:MAG: hypothetical protein FWH35_09050, partial [Treponema sp.]|nr:hypothetical protein [Treponema sp.]
MKILLQNSGKYIFLFLILIIFSSAPVFAQDGFGFGETEDNFGFGETEDNFGFGEAENNFGFGESSSSSFSIDIGGKVSAGFTAFFDDFSSGDSFKEIRLGDIFSGNLDFRAGGTHAEAIINIKIVPVFDGTSPITLDESFLRTFFSPVTLEGGLRKISWGRADSFGPLDIINPLDYTNMTKLSDPKSIKIARPMFRALWSMGSFTRLDAVFLPVFKGHKFASSGRWAPSQVNELKNLFERYLKVLSLTSENSELIQAVGNEYLQNLDIEDLYPDTAKLEYAQAGMRFTTSFGSSDFGFQYYFGRFHRPVVGEI